MSPFSLSLSGSCFGQGDRGAQVGGDDQGRKKIEARVGVGEKGGGKAGEKKKGARAKNHHLASPAGREEPANVSLAPGSGGRRSRRGTLRGGGRGDRSRRQGREGRWRIDRGRRGRRRVGQGSPGRRLHVSQGRPHVGLGRSGRSGRAGRHVHSRPTLDARADVAAAVGLLPPACWTASTRFRPRWSTACWTRQGHRAVLYCDRRDHSQFFRQPGATLAQFYTHVVSAPHVGGWPPALVPLRDALVPVAFMDIRITPTMLFSACKTHAFGHTQDGRVEWRGSGLWRTRWRTAAGVVVTRLFPQFFVETQKTSLLFPRSHSSSHASLFFSTQTRGHDCERDKEGVWAGARVGAKTRVVPRLRRPPTTFARFLV